MDFSEWLKKNNGQIPSVSNTQSAGNTEKKTAQNTEKQSFSAWIGQGGLEKLQESKSYPNGDSSEKAGQNTASTGSKQSFSDWINQKANPSSEDLYGMLKDVVREDSAVQKELDETNAALNNLNNTEPTTLYAALQHNAEVGNDMPMWGPDTSSNPTQEEVQGHGSQVLSEKAELEKKAKLLNDELYWNEYVRYMSNQNNAGFSKYSQYQQTGTNTVTDSGETALSGEDEVYEYINNRNGYRDSKTDPYTGRPYKIANNGYQFLQEDEIKVYNYLYHSKGKEAANQFLDFMSTTLNARYRAYLENRAGEIADEHPFLSSVYTVVSAPAKAVEWGMQVYDYLDDGKIDQNAFYNSTSYTSSAIRSKVADKIEKSGVWGVVGSFAYQTGMSMGDFLMTTAVSGGNQAMALAIMGSSAAADTTIQAKDRGLSDNQAFALGAIAGAAEILTEKIGLDALFDVALLNKNKFTYFLKNALGEAIEEPTSGLINMMADIYISKDKSEWEQSIKAYEEQGCSESDAFWKATLDQAKSLGLDALGGFASGAALGGSSIAINAVSNAIDNRFHKAPSGDVTTNSVQSENGQASQETAAEPQPGTLEYVQMLNDMGQATGNENRNAGGSLQTAFDMYEDVLAQGTNASADPVSAAVDAFMTNGTITNKQAQDILNNSKALQLLRERVGLELPSTASGRRNAVKAAVAQLAAQTSVDTNAQTGYNNSTTQGGNNYAEGLQQNDRAGGIGDPAQGMVGLQQGNGSEIEGRQEHGGLAVNPGILRVSPELTAAQQQNTQTTADAVTDTASNQNSVVPVKEHISMADFANQESPVWNNVDYTDDATKTKIMQSTHDSMVAEGSVVQVSDPVSESVEQAFPDLRSVKKKERTPILKNAMNKLKSDIRQFLNGFKNQSFEFEVNGKVLEATLYNTGINEVLDKITKQKANMLYSTGDIFQNARYLYSTQDYDGNPNVYRWNYFYTPVQIGNETVGVRIAVRDVVQGQNFIPESQVYNWGIKKDTSLGGVQPVENDSSHGASSDVSNNNIHKTQPNVNTDFNQSLEGQQTASPTVGAESGYAENTVGGAQSLFEHKQGISNVYSNTYTNATDESVRKVGEQSKAADPGIDNYDVITEKESTYNAAMRTRNDAEINFEYDDLMAKTGWTGEDNDTAIIVLDHLRKSGDSERLTSLARKQREEGTRSGQLVQSFAKYSKESATDCVLDVINVIDGFSESDIAKRHYKGQQFDQWKQGVIKTAVDVANQIDAVQDGDVEGMKEIIRSLARFRKTTAWFGYSSNLTKIANSALNDIDFDTAKAIANAQLSTLPKDFQKRSVGQVVKTIGIHNMLSALTTVNRNLGGNTTIGIVDAVSDSTVGRGLDYLVSLVTNKRTVGNDVVHAKTYFKGAAKAAKVAALCTELDIPMDSESRFSTGMTRTYSPQGGPITRFLSAYEKYMRYALEVTDQFYEGGTNAVVEKSLANLGSKSNLTAEETAKVAEIVGKRRTFKDDRSFARVAKGVKKILNEWGGENIGVGDLALPFAGIGSNVGQTAVDYSSLGIGGFIDIFRLMSDVKNGKYENGVKKIKKNGKVVREISLAEAQRQAVSNAARGLTGAGVIAAFTAFAAAGILGVHQDEDRDKRGLEQSLNLSGAQLNVDAAMRWVRGESTDWQDGDWCLSVDFLEPFNAQMYVGYLLSQEDSVQDMLKAYPQNAVAGIYQSVLDMPVMQGLSEIYDLFTNVGNTLSNGGEWEDVMADAGGQVLGNTASRFIPSWVRQTAQVIDPYYHDTTGQTAGERAVNQILAMIPGLSTTLPKKYNGLGQEQRRYDDLLPGIFNTMVNPGDLKQIKSNDVADYLDELSERTGNVTFYPSYIAPGSFQLDGDRITINGTEDTEKYQRTYGTNVNRLYGELIKNKDFLSASDEMQVKILNSAKDYAVMLAKSAVSDYSDVPSYIKKRASGMSEAEAILRHALLVKSNGDPVYGSTEKYSYLSTSDAKYVTDILDGIYPETGKTNVLDIQKIEAIVSADDVLNDEQQKNVLKDNVKESVYNKYLSVLMLGMDNDDYAASYRTYLDEKDKGGKGTKARIIASYQKNFHVTYAVAEKLYDIYAGKK